MLTERRSGLAVRVTAICLVVAGVMAVVAGLISTRLVVSTAQDLTRQTVADQADVIADTADFKIGVRGAVVDVLQGQGISVVILRTNGRIAGNATAIRAVREAKPDKITSGTPLHAVVDVDGDTYIVEGRAVDNLGSVALVRKAAVPKSTSRALIGNIIFALGIALLVAAVAGLLLARRLSKPLRRTATVAAGLTHGRRDLRAPVEGPSEVAEVANAVNELADALHRSESRQREFLLSVSHELRTPLTAVKGFAESLADRVVTGDDVPGVGRVIGQEANRLDRLVSDLLDLARLGADDFRLDLTEVALNELVSNAAEVWQARCDAEGVPFHLVMPMDRVVAHTDPRRLRQVLDGLAENALRVTPAGAPIVLSLTEAPGAAVLQVRDGGPGLAEEEYRTAFERGFLHSRYQGIRPVGTGIGLALVHGLVTRMGGTIQAGPAPEGGAGFTVTLPTSPPTLRLPVVGGEVRPAHHRPDPAARPPTGRGS